MTRLLAAVEAGGTKFVCAVGTDEGRILAQGRFPTTAPDETIAHAIRFLEGQQAALGHAAALGIAAFGPLDLHRDSRSFGHITSTPKPGWADTDLLGRLSRGLGLPAAIDTDVNAAALAEWRWGAGRGLGSLVYLTIGTGIGGGALLDGRPVHGLVHPEMGHILLPHDRDADPFPGSCPFHGDCFEGLASGPALEKRWQQRGESLPDDHPAWHLEAHYLALGLTTFICALSPERILLGGGVMDRGQLYPMTRTKVAALLHGYVQAEAITRGLDQYIAPPMLGTDAGIMGALALAGSLAESGAT